MAMADAAVAWRNDGGRNGGINEIGGVKTYQKISWRRGNTAAAYSKETSGVKHLAIEAKQWRGAAEAATSRAIGTWRNGKHRAKSMAALLVTKRRRRRYAGAANGAGGVNAWRGESQCRISPAGCASIFLPAACNMPQSNSSGGGGTIEIK
jgi:hypothetical protein